MCDDCKHNVPAEFATEGPHDPNAWGVNVMRIVPDSALGEAHEAVQVAEMPFQVNDIEIAIACCASQFAEIGCDVYVVRTHDDEVGEVASVMGIESTRVVRNEDEPNKVNLSMQTPPHPDFVGHVHLAKFTHAFVAARLAYSALLNVTDDLERDLTTYLQQHVPDQE